MDAHLEQTLNQFHLKELVSTVDAIKQPCIRGTLQAAPQELCASKVGGKPSVAKEFVWPTHNGQPLFFVAQLNCADIKHPLFPDTGLLLFFYDLLAWGFDPKDKGAALVIYQEETDTLKPGDLPLVEKKSLFGLKKEKVPLNTFEECGVRLNPGESIPSYEHPGIKDHIEDDTLSDNYCDVIEAMHSPIQILGHPEPVQGDQMQLECQLVTNGLYCGDATGYEDPRAKELEAGKDDWVLLLQLSEDDKSDMAWGDAGMIYYWIKKTDLESRHFENSWLILQCC